MSYPPYQGGGGGYPPQQPGGYGGYPPQQGYPPVGGPPQPQPQIGGYPPQTGGLGFENLAQQPAAQDYGPGIQTYPPPGAGYPPAGPPTTGYPPAGPPGGGYGPQPGYQGGAPGGYGGAPPPAQYQPPPQGYAPPPQTNYGVQQAAYGAPQQQYGAAPPQGAPGYGGAPSRQGYSVQPQYSQQQQYGAAPGGNYQANLQQATKQMAGMQLKTHGSIVPYPNFNAEEDAKVLRKAVKGLGTDEKAIINVVAYRTNKQRQEIRTAFKQAFGKDLMKELRSDVSGNYGKLLMGMMLPPAEHDAVCLHKAMKGMGTDEAVLIEILASRKNQEIKDIQAAFKTMYHKDLEKSLQSETSGHFKRLLTSLNNAARDESTTVDQAKAQTDAQNLYQAGEKKWGTDEAAFNLVMASRNYAQLRATFEAYHQISQRDIAKSLEREFSGDILKGMLAIVGVARDAPSYFAHLFYKTMKGLGTSDDDLIRVAISRSEVDMEEIKNRFFHMYKQPLAKFIQDDTSGDYKRLLLAIVGN